MNKNKDFELFQTIRKFVGGVLFMMVAVTAAIIVLILTGTIEDEAWQYVWLPGFVLGLSAVTMLYLVTLGRTLDNGETWERVSSNREWDAARKKAKECELHLYLYSEDIATIFDLAIVEKDECTVIVYPVVSVSNDKYIVAQSKATTRIGGWKMKDGVDLKKIFKDNDGIFPEPIIKEIFSYLAQEEAINPEQQEFTVYDIDKNDIIFKEVN